MKKLIVTAILCLLTLGTWGQSAKMSHYVRQAVGSTLNTSPSTFNTPPSTTESPSLFGEGSGVRLSSSTITAFVRITGTDADELLANYGCHKYAQLGDICIASIPLNRVTSLVNHPAVQRIEANPCGQLLMDTTATIINALPVYSPSTLNTPPSTFTGQGVVVGVMDVGFDLTHPNFYDQSATHYRIGAFWDQLSKDTIGSPFPVGRDYVGYEAVLAQQHSVDGITEAHGTHTLGSAVGSGYDSPYRGIAYESDICLVNNAVSSDIEYIDEADIYKYTTAVDALGFKYIFDYADQQGEPCVASFSEGYPPYLDEEDQLYAEFLEQLCGPGHIIVVSAGNENLYKTYLDKPAGMSEAGAFIDASGTKAQYRLKNNGPAQLHLMLYEGHESPRTLTFQIPPSTFSPPPSTFTDTLFIGRDTLAVTYNSYPSDFLDESIGTLELSSNRKLPQLPDVALVVEGSDIHVEVFGSSLCALTERSSDTRWQDADYGHNILAPGCFSSVICVGSTAHRTSYQNQYGTWSTSENIDVGHRSPFSSTGPTMSGLMKPDVMAPGQNIISSFNHFYPEHNDDRNNYIIANSEFNGQLYPWLVQSGTSMSTPIVAGVIALWLQAKPDLTPADILGVFSRTCRHPDSNMSYPNNEYGYGEIDAYQGLLDVLSMTSINAEKNSKLDTLNSKLSGWYTLDGRRITHPTKGIYIYNGHKIVIK